MTAVGKILVFMNLLFSVAVAGLIVTIYFTRTSWINEYEKMRNIALVAEAAYKTEKIARENDVKARDSQIATITNERKQFEDSVKQELLITKQLREENAKFTNEKKLLEENVDALKNEMVAVKDERTNLVNDVKEARAKILDVQKELRDTQLREVNNKIEADAYKQKGERLYLRLEELEKNNTVLQNKINAMAGSGAVGAPSLLNPPATPAPKDVKATVRAVATGSNLVVVNIGSDSGISVGNKLYVYRIDNQNPKNSLYLGELVINRTEPKQAV